MFDFVQKFSQLLHDNALVKYQSWSRDYGYVNFYDSKFQNKKSFSKLYWFAEFDKIDREKVKIIYDNRYRLKTKKGRG